MSTLLEKLQSLIFEKVRVRTRQCLYGEYDSSNPFEKHIQQFKKHIAENGQEKIFMEKFHKNCLPICMLLEQNLVEQNGTTAFCFFGINHGISFTPRNENSRTIRV